MYKRFIRPLLFRLPAELAHDLAITLTQFCRGPFKRLTRFLFRHDDSRLAQDLFGLHFSNPVGLAAGLDKYAKALHFWPSLGVGFAEVGGVTPRPQKGNPKPRVFRLPKDQSIINRFGLNNDGVHALSEKLKSRQDHFPVGVNIAKNESTSNENALDDYVECVKVLDGNVDFIVVNVSCPNSTDVDRLQSQEPLLKLLKGIDAANRSLKKSKPLLIKIGPDLDDQQLDDVVAVVKQVKIDGIVATNTSSKRKGLHTSKEKVEAIGRGGLSGQSITDLSTDLIRRLAERTQGEVPIIGVGGIASAQQAYEKIRAGASLVQLYTGLVYEGPGLIKSIKKGLIRALDEDGFTSIHQAIGSDLKS